MRQNKKMKGEKDLISGFEYRNIIKRCAAVIAAEGGHIK